MRVSLFVGDITDAPADAVCTSTNVRLSLMMGTGAAVRERGGFDILRACEQIVDESEARTGKRGLKPGSVHPTTAGTLPFRTVIHCVASDSSHLSSPAVVAACVRNSLAAAGAAGCRSVAMPVFAAGHARIRREKALSVMAEALRDAQPALESVIVVIQERQHADEARTILGSILAARFI